MIIVVTRCSPGKFQLVRVPVNVDGQIKDPWRWHGSRSLNGTDPEGFSAKDPLKGSEFLVDDCVILVQVGIFATRSTSVTYEKTFLYFHFFIFSFFIFPVKPYIGNVGWNFSFLAVLIQKFRAINKAFLNWNNLCWVSLQSF